MSIAYYKIRRLAAMEMDLWGGDPSTGLQGTFTGNGTADLLSAVDTTRPEPDDEWNGSYIVLNPGQTHDTTNPTIWRRISDVAGFVNFSGALTFSSPVPSSAYTASGMTYELYKTFRPEQWMAAVNYAIRKSYPYRHRLIWWETPEDSGTTFYDWGHMVSNLAVADPGAAAFTVTAMTQANSTWAAGTYKFAISYFNSVGQTLVSPVANQVSVTLAAGQCPEFNALTVPEQATGVNYWATPAPGGAQLARFTTGDGKLDPSAPAGAMVGLAALTFITPMIYFLAPPGRGNPIPPTLNTTAVDMASLTGIWRRTNPGQFPERFIDLAPDRWRGAGGQVAEIRFAPISQYSLRFIGTAPSQSVSTEIDLMDQPEELCLAGAEWYLWELLDKTASAQNLEAWKLEASNAKLRFEQAKADYKMEQPRRTMRRPFISVNSSFGNRTY